MNISTEMKPMVIAIDGVDYVAKPATVKSTRLEAENDHGLMDLWLHLEGPGWGQGFGGYALDEYKKGPDDRFGTAFGCEFIKQVIKTVGVSCWEKIPGSRVFALYEEDSYQSMVVGILSFDLQRAIIPKVLAKEYYP